MRNLLSANFLRLRKSRALWIAVAVMAAACGFELVVGYTAARQGADVTLDSRYAIVVLISGVVCSAFCAVFVGTEYSDGTLRNKITAGHKRWEICLANLVTSAAAGVLICLGYVVPAVAAGIPLLGSFQLELPVLLHFTLCTLFMTACLCAVFTIISLLEPNKTAAAIICIFLAYFLLFLGIYLNAQLAEPRVIPPREYIQDGQILLQQAMPNPAYVEGAKRIIFETLYHLPGCQAVKLAAEIEECSWYPPLVSLLFTAVFSAAGMFLFQRKDLK